MNTEAWANTLAERLAEVKAGHSQRDSLESKATFVSKPVNKEVGTRK